MMEIILQEHKTWPDTAEEKKIAKELELKESDVKLGNLLEEKGIIEFKPLKDKGLEIKTKSHIGTANFSSFKLNIIPKIYSKDNSEIWKNIATCIYFTQDYSIPKILEYQKIPFENNQEILQDFIIWGLVFECHKLIKKGILKTYQIHEENLPYLRGKLILKQQFQNDARKQAQFFCEFDELEYDNIENRIILYTLILCERIVISSELKRSIFVLIQQFSGLVEKTIISINDVNRVLQSYTRQNRHYMDVHKICKLIIENAGISDFYHGNIPFTVPFFLNMNDIFEDFVTKLFDKYHGDDAFSQSRQHAWEVDDSSWKHMKPDIILKNKVSKKVTIIDVKYKPKLSENDLYQIGFYIHEYRDKLRDPKDNFAFAILPHYPDESKVNHHYVSKEKRIEVYERHLSLDQFVEMIKNNDVKSIKLKIKEFL